MSKRFLVIGNAPLPFENPKRLYAGSIRTAAFVEELQKIGEVLLLGMRFKDSYTPDQSSEIKHKFENLIYYSIDDNKFSDIDYLKKLVRGFKPEVLIGVNSIPSYYATLLDLKIPFWADLNGSLVCEFQLKAAAEKDDYYVWQFLEIEYTITTKADKFSVVSLPQKFELIGELASINRVSHLNIFYDFVSVIQNPIISGEYKHNKQVLRKKLVAEEDFVVLWTGGYNYWTDIDFLYKGLSSAMEVNPKIKFVSLGGAIPGHNNQTFNKFKQLVNNSMLRKNFIFPGWVETTNVPNYYFESDIGINIDSYSYETLTGGRNRLNDMMKAGLPVLTTLGTSISQIIKEYNLGFTISIGDQDSFRNRILELSNTPIQQLKSMGAKGRDYAVKHWKSKMVLKEFLSWVQDPQPSPDNIYKRKYLKRITRSQKLLNLIKEISNPRQFKKVLNRRFKAFLDG
ncbi:glycosyltransferase [Candidatus Dependentiae bacterium]|nr:glycosyltransferase [Candidatus Dependentiae bacterium]